MAQTEESAGTGERRRIATPWRWLPITILCGLLAFPAWHYVCCYRNAQVRARVSVTQANLRGLSSALDAFFDTHGQYPVIEASGPPNISHAIFRTAEGKTVNLTPPVAYIRELPFDPYRGDGQSDVYQYGSNGRDGYIVTSYGSDGVSDIDETRYEESVRFASSVQYDSSNGMQSGGDIFRIGP